MRIRTIRSLTLAGAAAAVLLLGACTSSSSTTSTSTSTTTTPPATATGSQSSSGGETATVTGKTTFTMTAQDFAFSPKELDGSAGQALKITVTNDDSVPHNFSITSQKIDVTIEPGASKTITVTFPTSGSVQFFCKFHKVSNDMVGELKVG
ncbi:MAG TPA: cupredoxin domain-containing protein [Actinomycetota bacterium]|nr:cupredoxin domain-containing protein [Actinomycetota bacterium]